MKQVSIRTAGLLVIFWLVSFQPASGECGFAGSYAPENRTAQSNSFNREEILGAHRSLPPGTRVVVRNQQRGRSIIVRIFGPALSGLGQIIDLSAGAMHALGMEARAPVCFEVLTYGSESRGYRKLAMRNRSMQANRLERRRYAKAGSQVRLERKGRRTHKARARHGGRKRYARLHRHRRAMRRSGRHRRSARG